MALFMIESFWKKKDRSDIIRFTIGNMKKAANVSDQELEAGVYLEIAFNFNFLVQLQNR